MKTDALKKVRTLLFVLACISFVIGLVLSKDKGATRKFEKACSDFSVEITEKKPQENNYNEVTCNFTFIVKNGSKYDASYICGDMVIYDEKGNKLTSSSVSFRGDITAGDESEFELEYSMSSNDKSEIVWNREMDALEIKYEITEIYFSEHGSVLPTKNNVYTKACDSKYIEEKYSEAMSLYMQEEYNKALNAFEAVYGYEDSIDMINSCYDGIADSAEEELIDQYNRALEYLGQERYAEALDILYELMWSYEYDLCEELIDDITTAASEKAYSYAEQGDYLSAYNIMASINTSDWKTDEERAYLYASENDFANAVRCGLDVVIIPEGIVAIPDKYFYIDNCVLKKVVLPSTVKTIGNYAFGKCSILSEINLPEGLTSIGDNAFSGCNLLENPVFPSTLETIGSYAFQSCYMLTEVILPESLTLIGDYAFDGCKSLRDVYIPGSVDTIEDYAFRECTSLISIEISEGVKNINNRAFHKCVKLNKIHLPDSLELIGQEAFMECSALKEIAIPCNVERIALYAFWGCSSLESVVFVDTEGWTNNQMPSWPQQQMIDVTDAERNATRLTGGTNYYNATWYKV